MSASLSLLTTPLKPALVWLLKSSVNPTLAIELIIVDDGSTDETGNVLRQIHDDRLILIEQANQGVYAARNAALALHQGE